MKKENQVHLTNDKIMPMYSARDSHLFIDGQEITHFPADKPMFGIQAGELIISIFIMKLPNWKQICKGHHFDIVSLVDDDNEYRLSADYDAQKMTSRGDIIFDGLIPSTTLHIPVIGQIEGYVEAINPKFYPHEGVDFSKTLNQNIRPLTGGKAIHAKGGRVSHDKHGWI